MRWVHRYAIGGAAFAALPLPTSAGLAALQTHMFGMIGNIYGDDVSSMASAAAGGSFSVMGQGLRLLANKAVGFVPVVGPAIKAGIAAAAIEGIGRGVVEHFERKHPGKKFTRT